LEGRKSGIDLTAKRIGIQAFFIKEDKVMSKETAKKLIAELQTNEELKAKIAGITAPAEMVKKAV